MTKGSPVAHAVDTILDSGLVPGVSVLVARAGRVAEHVVRGSDAHGQPLRADSLFPVASITKMATALVVLRLVDEEELALDDELGLYLPDAAAAQPGVTIRTLLCHTSGAPMDVADTLAPYNAELTWTHLRAACFATALEAAPNSRVQYSNVGYGLLGALVEQITGASFAESLQTLVLRPLGIEGFLGDEPPRPTAVLANVRGRHAGTAIEPFNSPLWRSLALPWAGLVTTAAGALALVQAFAGQPDGFIQKATRVEATRNATADLAGGFVPPLYWRPCPWGLGPDLRGHKSPHWTPAVASPASFGHSGASGCLAWADPAADLAWVILGTRTADSGWLLRRGPAIGEAVYRG